MYEKKYHVELTGVRDSLMHQDNVEARDALEEWRKHPDNKKLSKAGDDRSPAFTWLSYIYNDGELVGWPSDNLMTMIRDAATLVPSSGKKTFKGQSQSGILVNEIQWPLMVHGKEIPWGPLAGLDGETSFEKHKAVVKKLGFELFVKPAKIGQSKHIRVRPRFSNWTCAGTLTVFDEMITDRVLQTIFDSAGRYIGLSDWRPKSPKSPGQFGLFTAKVTPLK
jgi:hypothetical protein